MGNSGVLRLTSCQAENSEFIARAVTRYLGERLGMRVEFVDDIPWQERERLLDAGAIHAGWICGLPYAVRADRRRPDIQLLAAPVMSGARYKGRPVYFSDIVVRRDSRAQSFEDLRGLRWGYNEPGSHSGYNIVRYHLARRNGHVRFFGGVVETGAHQESLRMIVEGATDASAIDSTVLETEFRRRPALRACLRVIESWGPSPAPPWVVSRRVPVWLRRQLRQVVLGMHAEPAGRAVLRQARMSCFAAVNDGDYDPIRQMASVASGATL